MSLTDQNTEETLKITGTSLKYLYEFIRDTQNAHMEKISRENMKELEKHQPQKIKLADIHKEDIDQFLLKARDKNINCFEIEEVKDTDNYNLKYSIDDEYKIVEAFKEIQLEKEKAYEYSDIDFEKLKEDLKKYTGKDINNEDFKKAVKDLREDKLKPKDKAKLEEIRRQVEPKVKEELERSQEDKFKKRNRGNIER